LPKRQQYLQEIGSSALCMTVNSHIRLPKHLFFLLKTVFLALGQKMSQVYTVSQKRNFPRIGKIFFDSSGLLSVNKHIHLPLLPLEEVLQARRIICSVCPGIGCSV
jgi:hypothetical protein